MILMTMLQHCQTAINGNDNCDTVTKIVLDDIGHNRHWRLWLMAVIMMMIRGKVTALLWRGDGGNGNGAPPPFLTIMVVGLVFCEIERISKTFDFHLFLKIVSRDQFC